LDNVSGGWYFWENEEEEMINSIKRFFASWHRIPKYKVPKWVRGKLHNKKYVKDSDREYKEVIIRKRKPYYFDDGEHNIVERFKHWKKQKFYYRKLK